jgi:ribosomal protein S24E
MIVNIDFFEKYTTIKKIVVIEYIKQKFGDIDLDFYAVVEDLLSSSDQLLVATAHGYKSNFDIMLSVADEISTTDQFRLIYQEQICLIENINDLSTYISNALNYLREVTGADISYTGIKTLSKEEIKNKLLLSMGLNINIESHREYIEQLLALFPNQTSHEYISFDNIDDLPEDCQIEITSYARQEKIIVDKSLFQTTLDSERNYLEQYFLRSIILERFYIDDLDYFQAWAKVDIENYLN